MDGNKRCWWLGAALVMAAIALLAPAAAGAGTQSGYLAESCYDAYVDCGTGEAETGIATEAWAAYDYSRGTCRTRWVRATRRNLFRIVVYRYNQQVRWCWSGGVITYFWRDRWPSNTAFGWTFDGHVSTNCSLEHCNGRGIGTYSAEAWTQGKFHVCVTWYCPSKLPFVSIWVHGDGGSGASAYGA